MNPCPNTALQPVQLPIVRKVRAQTFVPGENPFTQSLFQEFTGLDKKVYAKYLKLQEVRH